MLRSLLTTCATNNKYQPNSKGVDLNREWESSLNHFIFYKYDKEENIVKQLPEIYQQMLKDFDKYKENSDFCSPNRDLQKNEIVSPLKKELDRHRVTTSFSITSLFLILLKHFKQNSVWQFSFLIQLITDANGVLVFLKFLTEKFNFIKTDFQPLFKDQPNFQLLLNQCVYQILKLMFITCNNFPDKIQNFLLEYNAINILKKVPVLLQGEIQKIENYCSKLLRIQTPYFSKGQKKDPKIMKIITDIYCKDIQLKQEEPDPVDDYDCLKVFYDFEKIKERRKVPLYHQIFNNQDAVRRINQDFNNYHYLDLQNNNKNSIYEENIDKYKIIEQEKKIIDKDLKIYNEILNKLKQNAAEGIKQDSGKEFNIQQNKLSKEYIDQWLVKNVWEYYD